MITKCSKEKVFNFEQKVMASSSSNPNLRRATIRIPSLPIQPLFFTKDKLDGTSFTLWRFKIVEISAWDELLLWILETEVEPWAGLEPPNLDVMTPLLP